jgi:hypothetical protein
MASPLAQTPAAPAAETHGLSPLSSLILPGPAILTANTRPFSAHFNVATTGVQEYNLLDLPHLVTVSAGFSSARVVGPFQVRVVGDPGTTAVQAAVVTVGVMDSRWPTPDRISAQRIPDSVSLGVSLLAPTADAVLPFPDSFKNNLKVSQNAGVPASVVVAAKLVGFASVVVEITGFVELSGLLPLCPWPAPAAE